MRMPPRLAIPLGFLFCVSAIFAASPPHLRTLNLHDDLTNTDVLILCHQNWPGIMSATLALGYPTVLVGVSKKNSVYCCWHDSPPPPHNALTVPLSPPFFTLQNKDLYDESYLKELAGLTARLSAKALVINGPPYGATEAVPLLRRLLPPSTRLLFVFHGSFAEPARDKHVRKTLPAYVQHQREGLVDSVGFLKKGPAEFFRSFGARTATLGNLQPPRPYNLGKFSAFDGRFHIGFFGLGEYTKNALNQVRIGPLFEAPPAAAPPPPSASLIPVLPTLFFFFIYHRSWPCV
jgi:hypothetical protein